MTQRAVTYTLASVLVVATSVLTCPAQPWAWFECEGLPATPSIGLQDLCIAGQKGAAIYDGRYLLTTENGGQTWEGPVDLSPVLGPMPGQQVQCCARRGDYIAIGGITFVAAGNLAEGTWRVATLLDQPEGLRVLIRTTGGIALVPRYRADWGVRSLSFSGGADRDNILAAGWIMTDGTPAEVLFSNDGGGQSTDGTSTTSNLRPVMLSTEDGGQSWELVELPAGWPYLRGVIYQPLRYVIGPDGFLGERWSDGGQWEVSDYPDRGNVAITGWCNRNGRAWFARSDGQLMYRQVRQAWQITGVQKDVETMKVAFRTADQGVAIGNDRFGKGFISHTLDGGDTWQQDGCAFSEWLTGPVVTSGNDSIRYEAVVHLSMGDNIHVDSRLLWRPGPVQRLRRLPLVVQPRQQIRIRPAEGLLSLPPGMPE